PGQSHECFYHVLGWYLPATNKPGTVHTLSIYRFFWTASWKKKARSGWPGVHFMKMVINCSANLG
ncbi:hypothetical protein, partial [Rivihabitans pingtungensis]|uniref:hypothetical protein n=1 Tax=Rivihabitans pingtungensis TaxID=1054498 RepID=UPI002FDA9214